MRTSHGRFRPDAVDARPRHDGLFQGEGTGEEAHQERDSLLQALYTESLHARGDVDAVDRLLDAHREALGSPSKSPMRVSKTNAMIGHCPCPTSVGR